MTTHLNMANQIISVLTRKGLDYTTTKIIHIYYQVIIKISEHTAKQAVKSGFDPIHPHEFKEFIGILWIRSRLHVGAHMAFDNMKKPAKKHRCVLMKEESDNNMCMRKRILC